MERKGILSAHVRHSLSARHSAIPCRRLDRSLHFCLAYQGEGTHPHTYVTLLDHQLDARLVGVVSVVLALVLVATGLGFVRGRRYHN